MAELRKLPVTAIVSTKNEERAIERCLQGLTSFDQVIVVDSMSTDRTVDIARGHGAEVVRFEWNGRYPKKKQWCLDNLDIDNPWVFFVDADELPTPQLIQELGQILEGSDCVAFDVPLQYHFMGRELRHGHRVVKRALVRHQLVKFPVLDDLEAPGMGELEGHYQPEADGMVGVTRSCLRHDDPDPISTWINRHNKYSDWEAYLRNDALLYQSVRRVRSGQGKIFDRLPFKPIAFFGYSYLVRRGFLDGRAGFNYAFALAWYYWLISVKTREMRGWK